MEKKATDSLTQGRLGSKMELDAQVEKSTSSSSITSLGTRDATLLTIAKTYPMPGSKIAKSLLQLHDLSQEQLLARWTTIKGRLELLSPLMTSGVLKPTFEEQLTEIHFKMPL